MAAQEWLPPREWYDSLPSVLVATGGLITDVSGRVLLVKPNYRPYWLFPGGMLEAGEAPHDGCGREVQEETGLELEVGPLLVVAWTPPDGDRRRSSLHLLFDCGTVKDCAPVLLQATELDEYAFVTAEEGAARLSGAGAARLSAGLRARETGQAEYLPIM